MKIFKSQDPDRMRHCFDYDAISGNLIWKNRADVNDSTNTRFAGKVAGHIHTCTVGKKYIQVRVDGVLHYAHRIIWVMNYGPIPPHMEIDHCDGNGLNNILENLCLVSNQQNKRNMRRFSSNTSGANGVYLDKRRGNYSARVWENGKFLSLGSGLTFEKAIKVREQYNKNNGFSSSHGIERPL